jgi:predicted RNase H-like HicB family nuclease
MKIDGRLARNAETGKFWAVDIPSLGIHTQGKTKKEAYEMAKNAVETIIDQPGFQVDIQPMDDNFFSITANDAKKLVAAIIKRQRSLKGLTAAQVALKMGEKSVTGYLRYEQGKTLPSIEKLSDILIAIDPFLEPVLKIG